MKNILLTIFLCSASLIASSQTFTLNPKVSFGSAINSGSKDFICTITNNDTVNTDSFRWSIIKYNPPTAWMMSFCDPLNCYASISVGSNHNFAILKGASGQMHITYTFNNTGGWDTMKVLIKNLYSSYSDTITFIANAWMTGVKEANLSGEMSIYPNPVKDQLNVRLVSGSASSVDIYNIIGVKVKSFNLEGNLTKVNVSDLKNGVYILRITDGKSTYSKTFNKSE